MPILVVDDEEEVRCFLRLALESYGFPVIEADDGLTALGVVQEMGGNIAALVTDIQMNGMNGVDLAKRVTSEFPNIPVLLVSAAELPESARDIPGSRFLAKPFPVETLVQLVQQLVQQR